MSSYKHIILFLLTVYSASAFVPLSQGNDRSFGCQHTRSLVSSALCAATTDTKLFFKDHPDEDLSIFATTATTTVQRRVERAPLHPEMIYLPKHSDESAELARAVLSETELIVGRVAMMVAILLFGVELATGASLPDQLARYFG